MNCLFGCIAWEPNELWSGIKNVRDVVTLNPHLGSKEEKTNTFLLIIYNVFVHNQDLHPNSLSPPLKCCHWYVQSFFPWISLKPVQVIMKINRHQRSRGTWSYIHILLKGQRWVGFQWEWPFMFECLVPSW